MGNYATQPDFATEATAITPSDTIDSTTDLNQSILYVGVGGDVKVIVSGTKPSVGTSLTAADGVVFKNVSDGCWLPVVCDYVLATGTVATDIVAAK
jgi:hypothetical protein